MEKIKQNKRWVILALVVLIIWLVMAPPRFVLNMVKNVDLSDPVAAGEQVVAKYNCRSCHTIGGEGALIAPNLAGVTQRHDPLVLRLWLRNPREVKARTAMPNFNLSDSEIEAIIAYLESFDNASTP
ncbi:MAG: cytochrome c [Anaerolineae bacterium]|nr:MAG: cytochrome c [Anaerolineae bacterium]